MEAEDTGVGEKILWQVSWLLDPVSQGLDGLLTVQQRRSCQFLCSAPLRK